MEVIRYFAERKLLAFVTATILLQLVVVSLGAYLKWTLPQYEIAAPSAQAYENTDSVYNDSPSNLRSEMDQVLKLEDFSSQSKLNNEAPAIPGVSIVQHTIQSGDTLTKIWQKHASDSSGAMKAAKAFEKSKVPLSSLRVGSVVELQVFDGDITGLRLELYDGSTLVLDGDSQTGYSSSVIEPEIIEEDKVVSGVIRSSFSLAAQKNEIPYGVVDQLVDIFSSRIEFRRDVQTGDSFTVMYKERRLKSGRILEPGPVKAASFENAGRWVAAVHHTDEKGTSRYFDSKGKPIGSYFLRYPLKFTRISSVFNTSRFHPVLKRRRPHSGVDFAAPTGTPVRSVADGVVSVSGYKGGAGNMVKIQHSDKYASAYLHLSKISKGIRNGTRVKRGQVIGAVGSTGLATGPHLHYSFYVNGRYVDPLKVQLPDMPEEYDAIPAKYLEEIIVALKTSHEDLRFALKSSDKARNIG